MRFIFLFFILNCVFLKLPCFAEGPNILLIGLSVNELAEDEREKLTEYTIMERPFLPAAKISKLAEQSSAQKVIVKQSSGLIYEYSSKGHLLKKLEGQDISNFAYNQQMKPININNQSFQNSQNNNFNNHSSNNNYAQSQIPIYSHSPSISPTISSPTIYNGGQMPTPTIDPAKFQRPFPGANIYNNWYPGKSEYSYLPGEGDVLLPPGITTTRKVIKQLAGLAQNNAYPFWFDNYLTTSSNANSLLAGPNTGTNAGFPALEFSADTSSSAAVVGAQWFNSGIGIGATVLDAILSKRELELRRRQATEQANGTPNYVYPSQAYTVYPQMPYQPIPRN
jgi:hypothetical protein